MRIYLTGSHSSGKSLLANHIKEKYQLPMITEVARMVLSEKEWSIDSLRTDLEKVNQYQKEIFNRQLREEKKYHEKSFVSDRGLDFLCYSAQHATNVPEIITTQEWQDYINSLKQDDVLIFFVRPHKSLLKSDGVRETLNWDGVVAIDAMTKMLLQMYGLRYFQIDCVSMQERTNLVDNIVELFLAKEKLSKSEEEKPNQPVESALEKLFRKTFDWRELGKVGGSLVPNYVLPSPNVKTIYYDDPSENLNPNGVRLTIDSDSVILTYNYPKEIKYESIYDSNFLLGNQVSQKEKQEQKFETDFPPIPAGSFVRLDGKIVGRVFGPQSGNNFDPGVVYKYGN